MAVAFRAASTIVGGTTTATQSMPAGVQVDDVLILLAETANQAPALSDGGTITPGQGWEPVPGFTPAGVGTAGGTAATRLTAWWRRVSTASNPTVQLHANGGNHITGYVLAFSGCETAEDPFDGVAQDTAASSGSVTFPGVTTSVDGAFVVDVCAAPTDTTSAQFSGWTNAALSGYGELADQFNTSGNGGGIGVGGGTKATAGASGASTAALAAAGVQERLTFALKPPQTIDYSDFPVVESVTSGASSANATTQSIALPASVAAGDVLVALMVMDSAASISWDHATAGAWTALFNVDDGTGVTRLAAFWRSADGSEGGKTLSVATASEQGAWQVLRISGAETVEAATPAGGATRYPAPPSLTPSWGAAKTLWLAAVGIDLEATSVWHYPNNYGGAVSGSSTGGSGSSIASAWYRREAASEAPGMFIASDDQEWVAALIAVKPAASGPKTVAPSGLAGAAGLGAARLNLSLSPAGAANGQAFETFSLRFSLALLGAAGAEGFGGPRLVQSARPGGHAEVQGFGAARLALTVQPQGPAGATIVGQPSLSFGATSVRPSGLASASAVAAPAVRLTARPDGAASASAIGSLVVRLTIMPAGLAASGQFGAAVILPPGSVLAEGVAGENPFGLVRVIGQGWYPAAIAAQGWLRTSGPVAAWSPVAPGAAAWTAPALTPGTWTPAPPEPETWT